MSVACLSEKPGTGLGSEGARADRAQTTDSAVCSMGSAILPPPKEHYFGRSHRLAGTSRQRSATVAWPGGRS